MITVPLLPEVLHEIENQCPHLAGEELNNVMSGFFNSCIGIGEALGPISAGFIISNHGFRGSCDIIASILVIYTMIFLIFNGNFDSISLDESVDEDDNYQKVKDFDSIVPSSQTLETQTSCGARQIEIPL